MSLYAWLMLFSFIGPFALSFDKKVAYFKDYTFVLLASISVSIPFLIWDVLFTEWKVWGFNDQYLIGIRFWDLPIEEIAFFYIVPFCCIFIYRVLNAYFALKIFKSFTWAIGSILLLTTLVLTMLNFDKAYTLWTCCTFVVLLGYGLIYQFEFLAKFLLVFFVCLFPFFIVNGILTGISTPEPIVWYNPDEIIGFRVASIPVEDFYYNFNLLFSNILLFEFLKKKWKVAFTHS